MADCSGVIWPSRIFLLLRIHIDDFCKLATELILKRNDGFTIKEICGPEDLTGFMLARRIGSSYRALPIPFWWPFAAFSFKALHKLGSDIAQTRPVRAIGQ